MASNDDGITTAQVELSDRVNALAHEVDHSEMWGINIRDKDCYSIPYRIIMEKFLRANGGDVENAARHFENTLRWRKQIEPRRALQAVYKPEAFSGIGNISRHVRPAMSDLFITWNRYGQAKNQAETFGDVMAFLQYRIALMEAGIELMGLAQAKDMIPSDGRDPYRMIQVFDCEHVSFSGSNISSIIQQQCEVFSKNYPELMDRTILVNAPTMFSLICRQAKKHLKHLGAESKLSTLSTSNKVGELLAGECNVPIGSVPREYGGHHFTLFNSEPLIISPPFAQQALGPAADKQGVLKRDHGETTHSQASASKDGPVDWKGKQNMFSSLRNKMKHISPPTDASPAGDNSVRPSTAVDAGGSQPTPVAASPGQNKGVPKLSLSPPDDDLAIEPASPEPSQKSMVDGADPWSSSSESAMKTALQPPPAAAKQQQTTGLPA